MKLLDKSYVISLIVIAAICAFVGMTAGNLGNTAVALGACIAACLSASLVVVFGLVQWKK